MNNGDMPAMALSGDAYQDFAGYDGTNKTSYNPDCQGLTKREHFAAMAMQGMLASKYVSEFADKPSAEILTGVAEKAVICADALLKALESEK